MNTLNNEKHPQPQFKTPLSQNLNKSTPNYSYAKLAMALESNLYKTPTFRMIKNDILTKYNSFLEENETKPTFLTNFLKKTDKNINKLKFKSVCKTISSVETLNTLPGSNYDSIIQEEDKKLTNKSKELRLIPKIDNKTLKQKFLRAKTKNIDIEKQNLTGKHFR